MKTAKRMPTPLKLVSSIFIAGWLTGCATTEQFSKNMDVFLGGTEANLIGAMGPPQNSYQSGDGSKVLQFSSGRTFVMPGATTYQPMTTNTYGTFGNTAYNQRSTTYVQQQGPSVPISMSCVVNFTVSSSGIVTNWRAQGNDCKASAPR